MQMLWYTAAQSYVHRALCLLQKITIHNLKSSKPLNFNQGKVWPWEIPEGPYDSCEGGSTALGCFPTGYYTISTKNEGWEKQLASQNTQYMFFCIIGIENMLTAMCCSRVSRFSSLSPPNLVLLFRGNSEQWTVCRYRMSDWGEAWITSPTLSLAHQYMFKVHLGYARS